MSTLIVSFESARHLYSTSSFSSQSPYCRCWTSSSRDTKFRTRTCENSGSTAIWNDTARLSVVSEKEEYFYLEVKAAGLVSDSLIGRLKLKCSEVPSAETAMTLKILTEKGQEGGEVHLKLSLVKTSDLYAKQEADLSVLEARKASFVQKNEIAQNVQNFNTSATGNLVSLDKGGFVTNNAPPVVFGNAGNAISNNMNSAIPQYGNSAISSNNNAPAISNSNNTSTPIPGAVSRPVYGNREEAPKPPSVVGSSGSYGNSIPEKTGPSRVDAMHGNYGNTQVETKPAAVFGFTDTSAAISSTSQYNAKPSRTDSLHGGFTFTAMETPAAVQSSTYASTTMDAPAISTHQNPHMYNGGSGSSNSANFGSGYNSTNSAIASNPYGAYGSSGVQQQSSNSFGSGYQSSTNNANNFGSGYQASAVNTSSPYGSGSSGSGGGFGSGYSSSAISQNPYGSSSTTSYGGNSSYGGGSGFTYGGGSAVPSAPSFTSSGLSNSNSAVHAPVASSSSVEPIALQCPSCTFTNTAFLGTSAKTISCEMCGTSIPIPGATPSVKRERPRFHAPQRSGGINDDTRPRRRSSLPEFWEEKQTSAGKIYYVNHMTKTTQWERP